jgi:hypothetical protein
MSFNERNTPALSPGEPRDRTRRLRPRLRPPESARFKQRAQGEYPAGYLAGLARPFTSRRGAGNLGARTG